MNHGENLKHLSLLLYPRLSFPPSFPTPLPPLPEGCRDIEGRVSTQPYLSAAPCSSQFSPAWILSTGYSSFRINLLLHGLLSMGQSSRQESPLPPAPAPRHRGISAAAHPSAHRTASHTFIHPPHCLKGAFALTLNTLLLVRHSCGWGAPRCPAAGPLAATSLSSQRRPAASTSPHRSRAAREGRSIGLELLTPIPPASLIILKLWASSEWAALGNVAPGVVSGVFQGAHRRWEVLSSCRASEQPLSPNCASAEAALKL